MKIASIVGARPQFIKAASVSREIRKHKKFREIIIHTGQHFDQNMSDVFFREMEIPRPDYNLDIHGKNHGAMTGQMMEKIEKVLLDEKPDIVLIYGDTNSTLAGAISAKKLHITLCHVEAGLRSFNMMMPEEINRIIADHTSDLLLAPTENALKNLEKEGLGDKSLFTGDIMLDAVRLNLEISKIKSRILEILRIQTKNYCLATVHRAENTNNLESIKNLLDTFNVIAQEYYTLIFPIHPRTKKIIDELYPEWKPVQNLRIISPVGYLDMINLTYNAKIVLTDSGGLQKESFFLNTPCITLRNETEWEETIWGNGNIIAGTKKSIILYSVDKWLSNQNSNAFNFNMHVKKYFGEGNSASKIVTHLSHVLQPSPAF